VGNESHIEDIRGQRNTTYKYMSETYKPMGISNVTIDSAMENSMLDFLLRLVY